MKANGNILFWKCDVWALSRGWTYFSKECLSQEKLSLLNLFQDYRKHISPDASCLSEFFLPVPRLSDLSPLPAEPPRAESVPALWSAEVRGTTQSQLLSETSTGSQPKKKPGHASWYFSTTIIPTTQTFFLCCLWSMPQSNPSLLAPRMFLPCTSNSRDSSQVQVIGTTSSFGSLFAYWGEEKAAASSHMQMWPSVLPAQLCLYLPPAISSHSSSGQTTCTPGPPTNTSHHQPVLSTSTAHLSYILEQPHQHVVSLSTHPKGTEEVQGSTDWPPGSA